MKFSANLGFLWRELELPDAIRAAAAAGFSAVECHWPYDTPRAAIRAALDETHLPMLSLNTRPGDLAAGEFGLCALPGRGPEAREAIDQSIAWAAALGVGQIHAMAGCARGPEAEAALAATLAYACLEAGPYGIGILIEPINPHDVPGYALASTAEAVAMIERVAAPNLRMMFDCYHVQRAEGDVSSRLKALMPLIGHVQVAGVPDRGPPDRGELDYGHVFELLKRLGHTAPIGAEYRPDGLTDDSLGWMARFAADDS
ncbi:hydroxypyruvate isomerase family protein [Rhodovulum sp. MB263]|uniref:hydroxypyruvate isomerase family protein n=1 Tax=unclassified Rhodovulum TaxID=2631432 RepID=UPI0009B73B54|nr:TIM barrel protein [Rhodovulum sp. MB263]ARC88350.1 isomerase [Rhodovulum sp. MB263]